MRRHLPIILALAFTAGGCRTNPFNQSFSRFLRTSDPKMTAWLDQEVTINLKNIPLPLGNIAPQEGGRRMAVMPQHLSLWILNRIPGLGFERQPIILRGRAARGATIKVRNEAITRRELLYRFHKEYGIVMDLVTIGGRIAIRCRSREYMEIMEE